MSQMAVRRRLSRRSGDWRYHLNRWFQRNRPEAAVLMAFAIASLIGLIVVSIGIG